IELGWQGKFRGLNFEPALYRIEKLSSPDIVDVNGREIWIPIMRPATAEDDDARQNAIAVKELRLLKALHDDPTASISGLSAASDIPRGSMARVLARLRREKLAHEQLGKWVLTGAGKLALTDALKAQKQTETATR